MDVLRCRERPLWRSVGWAAPTSETGDFGHGPTYEDDPATIAEQADLHALLRSLINDLPANQRETLDLWADGFTYIQISAITNHSEGHIRVLVHRGLKALREHPRVKLLMDDEPTPTRSVSEGNPPAAQRRQHVAVGVSPRDPDAQANESPEGATR
jgi:DNA-binding CsgD family transcriptional regulator